MRGEAAREGLLDAAFDALVEEGPTFSLAAVAARARRAKGLVLHHFRTREGLLDAMAARVLRETQAGLDRLVEEYPDPLGRLEALARALLEEPRGTPRESRHVLAFWLLTDETGACRGALRDALLADFVARTVQEGAKMGALPRGVDSADVATRLLARWHGLTTLHAAGATLDFDREAETLAASLVAPGAGRPD